MNNNKYYKTDFEGLVKDPQSGAVLNIDNAKLDAYRKQKKYYEESKTNSSRLDNLENDIGEIKNMLQQLLTRQ